MTQTLNRYPAPGEKLDDHPIAQIFPMMNKEDKEELAKSIKADGLRDDIVLLDGMILDGRNRHDACLSVDVLPRFRFYDYAKDGASPTAYVMDKNLRRRHLEKSQLAAVAVESLPFFQQEAELRMRKAGNANLQRGPAVPPASAPFRPMQPQEPAPLVDEADQRTAESENDNGAQANYDAEILELVEKARKIVLEPGKELTVSKIQRELHLGFMRATEVSKALNALPPPAEPLGKATEIAAAAVGVSTRLVEEAKKIAETQPEQFSLLKDGEVTVNAVKEKSAETARKALELEDAYGRIAQVCGVSLAAAAREGTRLKGRKEVIAYAKLSDNDMLTIRGLIEDGWLVKKAVNYKMVSLCRTHRISDLLARAAAQAGTLTLEIDGWTIDVRRKEQPSA